MTATMFEDDDDLPVLTHVLRTRTTALPETLKSPLDDLHGDFDIAAIEEAPITNQIVIGNEPHPDEDMALLDGPPAPTWDASGSIVADPRRVTANDVFTLAQDADDFDLLPAAIDEPDLISAASDVSPPVPTRDAATDFSSTELAERVRENVLNDLASRIDAELDARIAQAMHAEVETALAQLQGRLRENLTEAMRDLVARAVAEEIARLRWSKANPDALH
jgi:hypothetical protein